MWDTLVSAGRISEADYSEDEKADMIAAYGKIDYRYSLMCYSTTPDALYALTEDTYYTLALQNKLFGEGGEYAPTEETLADYLASYVEDQHVTTVRYILFSSKDANGADMDEDQLAALKAEAENTLAELQALPADQLEDAFVAKQEALNADGNVNTFTFDDSSSLVDGFASAAQSLGVGEMGLSGLTSYGYFIILRYEPDTSSYESDAESNYTESTFDALISQWQEEYQPVQSDKLTNMNALTFFLNLNNLRETIAQSVSAVENEGASASDAEDSTSDAAQAEGDAENTADADQSVSGNDAQ